MGTWLICCALLRVGSFSATKVICGRIHRTMREGEAGKQTLKQDAVFLQASYPLHIISVFVSALNQHFWDLKSDFDGTKFLENLGNCCNR